MPVSGVDMEVAFSLADFPASQTPDSQGRRGSCKLTGMQTDTETHGCVGKLLWRRRDKLEWTEEAKEDRKREEPVKQPRCRSVD